MSYEKHAKWGAQGILVSRLLVFMAEGNSSARLPNPRLATSILFFFTFWCFLLHSSAQPISGPTNLQLFNHVDILPPEILGTNSGTVFAQKSGGWLIRGLPADGAVHIDQFGATARTECTKNIQAALDGCFTDKRIKRVVATSGTYYISGRLNLWRDHQGLELDFGDAWLLLTNQINLVDSMVKIFVANTENPSYGPVHPGKYALNINRLNLDGGLRTYNETGAYDELLLPYTGVLSKRSVLRGNNGLTIDAAGKALFTDGLINSTFKTINVRNMGMSGVAIYAPCINLRIGTINAYRIGAHILGVHGTKEGVMNNYPNDGIPSITVTNIIGENSCTLFDMSTVSETEPITRADWAYIERASGNNMFGRTKIAGNWGLTVGTFEMTNCQARVKLVDLSGLYIGVPTSFYPALSVANSNIAYLNIGLMHIINVPGGVLVSYNTNGWINITNLVAKDCYTTVSGGRNISVLSCTLDGCRNIPIVSQLKKWKWENAKQNYWATVIGNGPGSGGYSDTRLYTGVITQPSACNRFIRDTFMLSDGVIANVGDIHSASQVNSLVFAAYGANVILTNVLLLGESDSNATYSVLCSDGAETSIVVSRCDYSNVPYARRYVKSAGGRIVVDGSPQ